jgi:hypothetical protein
MWNLDVLTSPRPSECMLFLSPPYFSVFVRRASQLLTRTKLVLPTNSLPLSLPLPASYPLSRHASLPRSRAPQRFLTCCLQKPSRGTLLPCMRLRYLGAYLQLFYVL